MPPEHTERPVGPRLWLSAGAGGPSGVDGLFAGTSRSEGHTRSRRIEADCVLVDAVSPGPGAAEGGIRLGGRRGRAGRSALRRGGARAAGVGLGEALDHLGRVPGTDLAVRCEDAGVAIHVVEAGRSAGRLERLWLVAEDLETLLSVREESPATRLLHDCDPARQPRGTERHAAVLRGGGIEGVMVRHDRVAPGLSALMARFGRIVAARGAEYPRMVAAALRGGADIVVSPSLQVLEEGFLASGSEPRDAAGSEPRDT